MTDDLPDFSDITGEETEDSEPTESTTTDEKDDQMFIKGRYGTTTVRRDDGCRVCDRLADAVLLTDVLEGEDQPEPDSVILVCDDHEGDIRGDAMYGPNLIQRRDF